MSRNPMASRGQREAPGELLATDAYPSRRHALPPMHAPRPERVRATCFRRASGARTGASACRRALTPGEGAVF